jgi:hypothetical protein
MDKRLNDLLKAATQIGKVPIRPKSINTIVQLDFFGPDMKSCIEALLSGYFDERDKVGRDIISERKLVRLIMKRIHDRKKTHEKKEMNLKKEALALEKERVEKEVQERKQSIADEKERVKKETDERKQATALEKERVKKEERDKKQATALEKERVKKEDKAKKKRAIRALWLKVRGFRVRFADLAFVRVGPYKFNIPSLVDWAPTPSNV